MHRQCSHVGAIKTTSYCYEFKVYSIRQMISLPVRFPKLILYSKGKKTEFQKKIRKKFLFYCIATLMFLDE